MQDKKERKPNDPSLRLDGFVPHFFMHVPIVSKCLTTSELGWHQNLPNQLASCKRLAREAHLLTKMGVGQDEMTHSRS